MGWMYSCRLEVTDIFGDLPPKKCQSLWTTRVHYSSAERKNSERCYLYIYYISGSYCGKGGTSSPECEALGMWSPRNVEPSECGASEYGALGKW